MGGGAALSKLALSNDAAKPPADGAASKKLSLNAAEKAIGSKLWLIKQR